MIKKADVVIVGGGPAGFGIVNALYEKDPTLKIVLLEQADRFEGSGAASVKHFRTYQTHKELSDIVSETVRWYELLPALKTQKVIHRFPYVFTARTSEQLASYDKNINRIKTWKYGNTARILKNGEVKKRFSFIDRGDTLTGALVYPDAGWLNLSYGLTMIKKTVPAKYYLQTTVKKIAITNNKITKVRTNKGDILTDTVVLTPGPFIFTMPNITGDKLIYPKNLPSVLSIQKRQSFEAQLTGLPPQTALFLITPEGTYVRIVTNKFGKGIGAYGFADPRVPLTKRPTVSPLPTPEIFSKKVYKNLSQLSSLYETALAATPYNARAGYYVETIDHLPIVSKTNIQGLFLIGALSHFGVMMNIGLGRHLVRLMESSKKQHANLFDLYRSYQTKSGSVL